MLLGSLALVGGHKASSDEKGQCPEPGLERKLELCALVTWRVGRQVEPLLVTSFGMFFTGPSCTPAGGRWLVEAGIRDTAGYTPSVLYWKSPRRHQ